MSKIAFADESGTDSKSCCYTIGVVTIEQERLATFNEYIEKLKRDHGVQGEAKWTKVRESHGLINFALDCLRLVFQSKTMTYDAIVVKKELYRNWQGDAARQEHAFYVTYTELLRHIARRAKDVTDVLIDERSDSYEKHDDAIVTIGNRMLARLSEAGSLRTVRKARSHEVPGIQVADVLTGAINAGHLMSLQETSKIHPGKRLALDRFSQYLGWEHLAYDTYPHPRFNVWHFPQEFRGTSRDPQPAAGVPYVSAADLLKIKLGR